MWPGEAVAAAAAFCGGAVVATALAAFIIELGIIPRFAGITHTANHILLYETCLMLGSFLGNLVSVYEFSMPFGKIFLGIMALCFGIFLGSWIIALGEVVNVPPPGSEKRNGSHYPVHSPGKDFGKSSAVFSLEITRENKLE